MKKRSRRKIRQRSRSVVWVVSKGGRPALRRFRHGEGNKSHVSLLRQGTAKNRAWLRMAGAWKDDFPPLLPLGWHEMDAAAVRRLCVERFRESITRPRLMTGLDGVIERLNRSGLHMEVWIDGSFTTQKLNPDDTDVAVQFLGEEWETATVAQKQALEWASGDGPWDEFRCDCYPFPIFAAGHALYDHGQWRRAYWLNKFGHNRAEQPKGLAVVKLPFLIR